jgi:hypothetical protein
MFIRMSFLVLAGLVGAIAGCEQANTREPERTSGPPGWSPLMFHSLDENLGAQGVLAKSYELTPDELIIRCEIKNIQAPDRTVEFDEDGRGLPIRVGYECHIDGQSLRAKLLKIDTSLKAKAAVLTLGGPPPHNLPADYVPRAEFVLEYEIALSVVAREDRKDVLACVRIRSRVLDYWPDNLDPFPAGLGGLSWLEGIKVIGPRGYEKVIESRQAQSNCWVEALIPIPPKALGVWKETLTRLAVPEKDFSLILAHGYYEPILSPVVGHRD